MINSTLFMSFILQVGVCKLLIQAISRRNIDGVSYVSADVSLEYKTSMHITWMVVCIIPTLIFYAFIIPGMT